MSSKKRTERPSKRKRVTKKKERKHGKKNAYPSLSKIRDKIMSYFVQNPNHPVNHKQVSAGLDVEVQGNTLLVEEILNTLADDKVLTRVGRDKYKYVAKGNSLSGYFKRTGGKGHNALIPDDRSMDPIRIAERNSHHALDGDHVVIQLLAKRRGQAPEGEVIQFLERADSQFVGVLSVNDNVAFLLTESNKLANDIFIPFSALKGGKDGDKALVRITEWPEDVKNPAGEVIDIIGKAGDNTTEMHAILAEFGLPYVYPKEVEEAADKLNLDYALDPNRFEREDFRDVPTLTIDPADAKDFDDALSFRPLENGEVEVGVHIADVTAYVDEGSIIDNEAKKRATSVYLVDRTIPMLPERLCNDICSLRPNEERAAYAVIFNLDQEANVKKQRIVRTVIKSDARLTYEEAQQVIESGEGDNKDIILPLNKLARILRERRFRNGAIDFERTEMKFIIDEKGKPLEVVRQESNESHQLIEEYMLLANRTVAAFIGDVGENKKSKTFVYRVHDLPDPQKLQELSTFVMKFGYRLQYTGSPRRIAESINKMLDKVQGRPEENLIETVTIRTMSKARYDVDNVGHYGLGFPFYTHFTSPIRRHPDMMVHRLLTMYINGAKSQPLQKYSDMCEHDSEMENIAAKAERASIKYKQVEYLSERLGQVFDGVISGVTDWGLYVEIVQNGCEGMVPICELDDDYYEFDERNYRLVGFNTKKSYSLGDNVTIRVSKTNLERKQIDFELL